MKVLAIAQHKGGVGKTTSTINLGAALARKGHKVLLIDLDAQANLTASLDARIHYPSEDEVVFACSDNTYAALRNPEYEVQVFEKQLKPAKAKLDILPAGLELAAVEAHLMTAIGREYKLKQVIEPLRKKYDYILIDCPPSLGLLCVNALTAADEVLIPLQAEYLAITGLDNLLAIVDLVKKQLNKKLKLGGVFITQYDKRKILNRDATDSVREKLGKDMLYTKIRDNVALAEAPIRKLDVYSYEPTAAGAQDYADLAIEILSRHKK
jgi:chromosome partitioning protein